MIFTGIKLENFRNYKDQSLEFCPGLNLVLGNNAQGKTNILESLFIMSLGKSFRTNNDKEMIGFGSDFARAKAFVLQDDGRKTEIEIVIKPDGKIINVDGIKLSRSVDLLENVYTVVFSPEDLRIIKDGPEKRRRYIDRELCQIKPVYYSDLGNYKKVLKQRNMLLRNRSTDKALISVFNEALSDYGIRIVRERLDFIKRIEDISRSLHRDISSGAEDLDMSYETHVNTDMSLSLEEQKDLYKAKLDEGYDGDLYKGFTTFGPHKDDLCIKINGIDIRQYGSQGQQRTAALSMKLAEIGLIKQETGCSAVLLLDDVLSELDPGRQRFLIETMKDVQLFVSAAGIDEKIMELLPAGKIFTVEGGTVTENLKLLT